MLQHRRQGELDLARAAGTLPASTAACAIAAARRELLGEVRILLGGNRVDKRNLPAEQGTKASAARKKGRAALQSWRGYCETKGGRAYLVQRQSSQSDFQSARLGSLLSSVRL